MSYDIRLDLDGDESYSHSIAHVVLEARWRLGMTDEHDTVADVGRAQITLRNWANSALEAWLGVRLRIFHGAQVLFTGLVASIVPTVGALGAREAVLTAHDSMAEVEAWRVRLPVQVNARADEVLNALLRRMSLRPVPLEGVWRLSYSLLGRNTRLRLLTPMSFDVGRVRFAYVGDTWGEGVSARSAIAEVVSAEGGRFFVTREGVLRFANRHDGVNATPAATLNDDMHALELAHERPYNAVSVRYAPRKIGTPATPIWVSEDVLACPPLAVREVALTWRNAQDAQIGALDVLPLRPQQDYLVTTRPDPYGRDITSAVEVRLRDVSASGATLWLRNPLSQYAYVHGLRAYGTPITAHDAQTITAHAYDGLARDGLNVWRRDLPALNTPEQADIIARYALKQQRASPTYARRVTPTHAHTARAYTLGDTVRLIVAHPPHDARYRIVGEEHTLTQGGTTHRATWTLARAHPPHYWQLRASALGTQTRLFY
jgi:hypothetical protein